MRSNFCLLGIAVVSFLFASCAQPDRTGGPAKAPTTGSRFSAAGKVRLHSGQPCASQIMFDFKMTGSLSTIPLAAPMRESRFLTDAANGQRRVRIWGNWHHGQDYTCSYVNVTKAEPLSIAVVF